MNNKKEYNASVITINDDKKSLFTYKNITDRLKSQDEYLLKKLEWVFKTIHILFCKLKIELTKKIALFYSVLLIVIFSINLSSEAAPLRLEHAQYLFGSIL